MVQREKQAQADNKRLALTLVSVRREDRLYSRVASQDLNHLHLGLQIPQEKKENIHVGKETLVCNSLVVMRPMNLGDGKAAKSSENRTPSLAIQAPMEISHQ